MHLNDYRDIEDARAQIGRFIDDVYLTKRIHSALGYLMPAECEQCWSDSVGQDCFLIRKSLK